MNIPRLGVPQLDGLPPAVKMAAYDRSAIQNGIVHLGIGAFMRCHLAVATETALDSGDLRWGIVGVEHELRKYELALVHGGFGGKPAKNHKSASQRRSNRDQTETPNLASNSLTYDVPM